MQNKCKTIVLGGVVGALLHTPALAQESRSSIEGDNYAIVAPVYDGTTGPVSYLRLFNGSSAASAFELTVVNSDNGITLGAASISVPAGASAQYPVVQAGGANSIFEQASVGASSSNYAVYIQNTTARTGYAHVTYNTSTAAFENHSLCETSLNEELLESGEQALINVHASSLAGNQFPSVVSVHNYEDTTETISVSVSNAVTGASLGQLSWMIEGNSTMTVSASEIESQLGVSPTADEFHLNLVFSRQAGGEVPIQLSHTVRNDAVGGIVNLSAACAVNEDQPEVIQVEVEPSVPVAYCGTVSVAGYSYLPVGFTASITPQGRIEGTMFGQYEGITFELWFGSNFTGTVQGTSWIASGNEGGTGSGSIANGLINGTFFGTDGTTGTLSGSINQCYS